MEQLSDHVCKVTWTEARTELKTVNPELVRIIDNIAPDDSFPLYEFTYDYGELIEDRVFYYPLREGAMALNDARVPATFKKDLEYAALDAPIGIVLEGAIELFLSTDDRVSCQEFYTPGAIFSLWATLDSSPILHPPGLMTLSSGARSIFMLPNIGDQYLHKNLKRDFNLKTQPPKELLDHWHVFTELTQKAHSSPWKTRVVVFTGKWFDKIKNDPAWSTLKSHLVWRAWLASTYDRNKALYDFVFSWAQKNRNLRPNPYLADTVKHLMMVAMSGLPGFGVATDDTFAPIDFLQRVYIDSYKLKKYAPIFLHPMRFNLQNPKQPMYHSLHVPASLEFSPKSRKITTILDDLEEIRHILKNYLAEILSGHVKAEGSILGEVARKVAFEFFQSKADRHQETKLTMLMPEQDPAILHNLVKYKSNPYFADSGTFVRGCVRIDGAKNHDDTDT